MSTDDAFQSINATCHRLIDMVVDLQNEVGRKNQIAAVTVAKAAETDRLTDENRRLRAQVSDLQAEVEDMKPYKERMLKVCGELGCGLDGVLVALELALDRDANSERSR